MPRTLVLLRHGQSTWNEQNLFTGWYDADLTPTGEDEARRGGSRMLEASLLPDVVHTSVQTRAIRTADLCLHAMGRSWIPVRRHWRLNERHYGDLQGRNKADTAARYGEEQVHIWRRSYDIAPPPMPAGDERSVAPDPRYADLAPDVIPPSECLRDVVERMLPYWFDGIIPDLAVDRTVLVAAHGNSLRALVKHLDGISDDEITALNIPTGEPLVYELDDRFQPLESKPVVERYLASPADIAAAAQAVADQARG